MKTIVAILATSAILSACTTNPVNHTEKKTNTDTKPPKIAQVTPGVFIVLTDETCTMFESPPNQFLFKAKSIDYNIKQRSEGCYSKEPDDMVVINLVNTTTNNMYGYTLHQALFKDMLEQQKAYEQNKKPVEVY